MSAIVDQPLVGTEAQHIYLRFNRNAEVYDFVSAALPISWELHLNAQARVLLTQKLAELRECTTEAQVDDVFAAARKAYDAADFKSLLSADREGGWSRTAALTRMDSCAGHIVDIGNYNNKLGEFLLRHNSQIEHFTGVDMRNDPGVLTGERLDFRLQEREGVVPLPDASADLVAIRLFLHHQTFEVQQELIREARRLLRPGGRIVLVEDSFAAAPALHNNAMTTWFGRLSDADKLGVLALFDASSCLMTAERIQFAFSYRSAEEWAGVLRAAGFPTVTAAYWGYSAFTVYGAPMVVVTGTVDD